MEYIVNMKIPESRRKTLGKFIFSSFETEVFDVLESLILAPANGLLYFQSGQRALPSPPLTLRGRSDVNFANGGILNLFTVGPKFVEKDNAGVFCSVLAISKGYRFLNQYSVFPAEVTAFQRCLLCDRLTLTQVTNRLSRSRHTPSELKICARKCLVKVCSTALFQN